MKLRFHFISIHFISVRPPIDLLMVAPPSSVHGPKLSPCAENVKRAARKNSGRRNTTSNNRNAVRTTMNNGGLLPLIPNPARGQKQRFPDEKRKPSRSVRHSLHGLQEETAPSILAKSKRNKRFMEEDKVQDSHLPVLPTVQNLVMRRQTSLRDYGLAEGQEIPRTLYVSFVSEIVKIERQLREEKTLREIQLSRERYEIKKLGVALQDNIKFSTKTARPSFSYFPNVANPECRPGSQSNRKVPYGAEVNSQRVHLHQEETARKMRLFYRRHPPRSDKKAGNAVKRS